MTFFFFTCTFDQWDVFVSERNILCSTNQTSVFLPTWKQLLFLVVLDFLSGCWKRQSSDVDGFLLLGKPDFSRSIIVFPLRLKLLWTGARDWSLSFSAKKRFGWTENKKCFLETLNVCRRRSGDRRRKEENIDRHYSSSQIQTKASEPNQKKKRNGKKNTNLYLSGFYTGCCSFMRCTK